MWNGSWKKAWLRFCIVFGWEHEGTTAIWHAQCVASYLPFAADSVPFECCKFVARMILIYYLFNRSVVLIRETVFIWDTHKSVDFKFQSCTSFFLYASSIHIFYLFENFIRILLKNTRNAESHKFWSLFDIWKYVLLYRINLTYFSYYFFKTTLLTIARHQQWDIIIIVNESTNISHLPINVFATSRSISIDSNTQLDFMYLHDEGVYALTR